MQSARSSPQGAGALVRRGQRNYCLVAPHKVAEVLHGRPLDIIATSSQLPKHAVDSCSDDLVLGYWYGKRIVSAGETESLLRILMRAVDDVFDRAEATLSSTSYRLRCWLASYGKDTFYQRPLRHHKSSRQARSLWKQFICYIFRALAMGMKLRQQIFGLPLGTDEKQMMRHIVQLAQRVQGSLQSESHGSKNGSTSETEHRFDDELRNSFLNDVRADSRSEEISNNGSDNDYEDNPEYVSESDSDSSFENNSEDSFESDAESDSTEEGFEQGSEDGSRDVFGMELKEHRPTTSIHIDNRPPHDFVLPCGIRLQIAEAMFQLSMMFWTYQSQTGNMTAATLIYFTAILGLHKSSLAFRSAYHSTPGLARMVWIGRLFFLEYSLPLVSYRTLVIIWPSRHFYPSQPQRLQNIRQKYMLRGCHSPLGEIYELKAVGRDIVKQEGPAGNLTWAQDGKSFVIGDNAIVRLAEFCTAYHASLAQVRDLVDELMLGWSPEVNLCAIRDDLTCKVPGWCFLDDPANNFAGKYKALARRAWSSSFRDQRLAKAGHWLPGTCKMYFDTAYRLYSRVFAAFHLTAGLPARGPEGASIRVRNTELVIRNVVIRHGQVMVIIQYNKARATNNHAFYVVRFLPRELGLSVVIILVYIRPFLDFLAYQLRWHQYESTEYLFPDSDVNPRRGVCKKHMTSPQASNALQNLTRNLYTPWTIALYRQAALAIAKRHISELIKRKKFYRTCDSSVSTRMIAAGVGHHPRTLLTAYAIDKALPARLQPELLDMYQRLSSLWQEWNETYFQEHYQSCVPVAIALGMQTRPIAKGTKRAADAAQPGCPRSAKERKLWVTESNKETISTTGIQDIPTGFIHNKQYHILICVACESMVQPGQNALYRHLNRKHRITGQACQQLVQRLALVKVLPFQELNVPSQPVTPVPGLKTFKAQRCNLCRYFTIHLPNMHAHIKSHNLGVTPKRAGKDGAYEECFVQTFSSSKGLIRYFEVEQGSTPAAISPTKTI